MLRRLLRANMFIVEFAATRNVELVAAFCGARHGELLSKTALMVRCALCAAAESALRPLWR